MDIPTTIDPALLSQSPPHFDTTDGDAFNRGRDSPLAGSRSSSSSSRSTSPEIPLADVLKRKRRQTRSASGEKAQRLHQDDEDEKEEEEVTPQWTPEFKPRPSKRIKLSEFAENDAEGSGTQQDPIFVDIDPQTIWSLKEEETVCLPYHQSSLTYLDSVRSTLSMNHWGPYGLTHVWFGF